MAHSCSIRDTVRIALHAAHCFFVSRRYRRSVQQHLAPDQLQLRLPGLKDTRVRADKLRTSGCAYATHAGVSIRINDILIPDETTGHASCTGCAPD